MDSSTMWYACSIIEVGHDLDRNFQLPIELGSGVKLERIPEWVKGAESLRHLSLRERTLVHQAQFVLSKQYRADALGSPDPEWSGSQPRAIQSAVDEKFALAGLALWISKPTTISGSLTIHFGCTGEPESLRSVSAVTPVLISDKESVNSLNRVDICLAATLFTSILSLERDAPVWIATRMLMQALTQRLWESRYLWEWIVLECLFGPESPQETTFRLSQRIAFFTGTDASEREKIFSSAKDAYKWRSKIVHGGRISRLTSEKSLDLVSFSEGVIRSSMVRILNESQVCSALNGSGREAFLESLVFAGGVLAVDRGYTGSPT